MKKYLSWVLPIALIVLAVGVIALIPTLALAFLIPMLVLSWKLFLTVWGILLALLMVAVCRHKEQAPRSARTD